MRNSTYCAILLTAPNKANQPTVPQRQYEALHCDSHYRSRCYSEWSRRPKSVSFPHDSYRIPPSNLATNSNSLLRNSTEMAAILRGNLPDTEVTSKMIPGPIEKVLVRDLNSNQQPHAEPIKRATTAADKGIPPKPLSADWPERGVAVDSDNAHGVAWQLTHPRIPCHGRPTGAQGQFFGGRYCPEDLNERIEEYRDRLHTGPLHVPNPIAEDKHGSSADNSDQTRKHPDHKPTTPTARNDAEPQPRSTFFRKFGPARLNHTKIGVTVASNRTHGLGLPRPIVCRPGPHSWWRLPRFFGPRTCREVAETFHDQPRKLWPHGWFGHGPGVPLHRNRTQSSVVSHESKPVPVHSADHSTKNPTKGGTPQLPDAHTSTSTPATHPLTKRVGPPHFNRYVENTARRVFSEGQNGCGPFCAANPHHWRCHVPWPAQCYCFNEHCFKGKSNLMDLMPKVTEIDGMVYTHDSQGLPYKQWKGKDGGKGKKKKGGKKGVKKVKIGDWWRVWV